MNKQQFLSLNPGIQLPILAILPRVQKAEFYPTDWEDVMDWANENGYDADFEELEIDSITIIQDTVLVYVVRLLMASMIGDDDAISTLDEHDEAMIQDWENEDDMRRPVVLEWEGSLLLLNGHHRLCAHALTATPTMTCEVWRKSSPR